MYYYTWYPCSKEDGMDLAISKIIFLFSWKTENLIILKDSNGVMEICIGNMIYSHSCFQIHLSEEQE